MSTFKIYFFYLLVILNFLIFSGIDYIESVQVFEEYNGILYPTYIGTNSITAQFAIYFKIFLSLLLLLNINKIYIEIKKYNEINLIYLYIFCSVLWSIDPLNTLITSLNLFFFYISYIYLISKLSIEKIISILFMLIQFILFSGLLLLIINNNHVFKIDVNNNIEFKNLFPTKNALGTVCSFSLIFLYVFLKNKLSKLIYYFCITITLANLLLSNSITSILGSIFSIQIAFLYFRIKRHVKFSLVISILVTISVFLVFSINFILRFVDRDLTFSGRTELWESIISFSFDKLLGYGYSSSSSKLFFNYSSMITGQMGKEIDNSFISMSIELGLIFSLYYYYYFSKIFNRAISQQINSNEKILLSAIYIYCMILSIFESSLVPTGNLISIILLITLFRYKSFNQFHKSKYI